MKEVFDLQRFVEGGGGGGGGSPPEVEGGGSSSSSVTYSGAGVLLSVCDDGWSGASNVATLNASGQTLTGDILVGENSTLTLNLTEGTVFTGIIDGNITNNAGTV